MTSASDTRRLLPRTLLGSLLLVWLGVLSNTGRIGSSHYAAAADRPADSAVRLNKTIALFESNKPAFGIFSYGRSLRNAVGLSASKLDFVLVDMEHGPVDFEALQAFFLAMADKRRALEKGNAQPDVVPMVRLPQNGREQLQFFIKQALDLGAYGLMLPHIETGDEALAAVRSARYAQPAGVTDAEPAGQRGVSYGFPARVWGIPSSRYLRLADVWPHDPRGEILLIFQIESKRGVENVEQILAVPGVGAVFIGPADLSMSLGVDMNDPRVEQAIERVLKATQAHGVPCGITATDATAEQRLKQGFRFLTLGGDIGPSETAGMALRAARKASGRDD